MNGFSLLEVLVALAVAGIVLTGMLGLMQQNVDMAAAARDVGDHINLAQETLLTTSPDARNLATVPWTKARFLPDYRWRLEREERKEIQFRKGFEDGPRNATATPPVRLRLQTAGPGRQMTWEWLEPPASATPSPAQEQFLP